MPVLLVNRRQARKVRWLTVGFAVAAVGALFAAWHLYETYGLSPGDGGILRPWIERAAVAAGVSVLGLLPVVGMAIYANRYLTGIERQGEHVTLTAVGLLGERRYRYQAGVFGKSSRHEGRMQGRISVNAPWMTLWVQGRRLPFVVDLQAEHVDTGSIAALGRGKNAE